MTDQQPGPDPEDRRQHLDFIQAIVTRMSAASASTKSWLLPVVTATYGYGMTRNAWSVVALGIGAVILFMFLDANYLRQERDYRDLYDAVARDEGVPLFSLNTAHAKPQTPSPGDLPDISPGAEDDDGEASPAKSAKGKIATLRDDWFPPASVWVSWSIAPFYGSLLVVGAILVLRLGLS